MRTLMGIAALLVSASTSVAQTWLVESVPTGDINGYSSIVVDSGHIPHVAATTWYDGRFYYHSRLPGGWAREEIARYGGVGSGRALRLDSNGFARIYVMEAQLATKSAAGWAVTNIVGGSDWQAMAIDAGGAPRVAYIWSWGSGSYNGGFVYENEPLSPNKFMPTWASCELEFDAGGEPHIVAMLDLGQPIRHWRRTPGGWTTEDIDVGAWPSIAFDAQGRLHVCYYQHPSHVLVHAVRNGDNDWITTPVDTDGDVGIHPSLGIDSAGRLNVSYYDATNKDLRLARSGDGGASWNHVTVDATGDVGKYSSLAVDDDAVHISYGRMVTADSDQLRYARLIGSLTGTNDLPVAPDASIRAVPNPFNPATTLEYSVPVRGRVRVVVYDAVGRVVATLVDAVREPGVYRVPYRASGASGVYFAHIDAGGATAASAKLVLLK